MPGMSGIQLSEVVKDLYPDVEVISTARTIETAVEAMFSFHYTSSLHGSGKNSCSPWSD